MRSETGAKKEPKTSPNEAPDQEVLRCGGGRGGGIKGGGGITIHVI